jgi:chromosome segregation protein
MHLKCLEIERFKSFGPYTRIPLLEGFTVVSGPNGSGKSNIIDALLFALGLSTSRGMRAEKLSDLIHQGVTHGEASVTATFHLDEGGDLVVCRRLRVNGTNSTSTYYLDGAVCTLSDLHERLGTHHIYPEGYNVVLQGDVTGIITMPSRERREIIDELAGVAEFDRKIEAARRELGDVEQCSERIQVVLVELKEQMDRLQKERTKAEEYRQLRGELQQLAIWEQVLQVQDLLNQIKNLRFEKQVGEGSLEEMRVRSELLGQELEKAEDALDTANTRVKAMGETEQLALRSQIAELEARRQQSHRALAEIDQQQQQARARQQSVEAEMAELSLRLGSFKERQEAIEKLIQQWTERLGRDRESLESARSELEGLSAASQRWVEEQAQLRRQLESLQQTYEPKQRQFQRLEDRLQQETPERLLSEIAQLQGNQEKLVLELQTAEQQAQTARQTVEKVRSELESERAEILVDKTTQRRLEKERQEKGRELDRYEAQRHAYREAEGSRATQEVLAAKLPGVFGLISQLGKVEPAYQTALEIAAGGRLNNIVVSDDNVASQAIELLKQRRAGRATFLPLNKLKPQRYLETLRADGAVGYAIELIDFDSRYENAFGQVFGDTVIFKSLEQARRQIGSYRMVTLAGELLEKSGAMTGGSQDQRRGSGFATSEPPELLEAQKRLADLDTLLRSLTERIDKREQRIHQLQSQVDGLQRLQMQTESRFEQLRRDQQQSVERLQTAQTQLTSESETRAAAESEKQTLATELVPLQAEIERLRLQLAALETSNTHPLWQQSQQRLRELETEMRRSEVQQRNSESDLQKLRLEEQLCQEKRQNLVARTLEWEQQKVEYSERQDAIRFEIAGADTALTQLGEQMAQIEVRLEASKRERDSLEKQMRTLQNQKRQCDLQREQELLRQEQRIQSLVSLEQRLEEVGATEVEVEIPADLTLEQVQQQRQRKQRRLESLEPVNMLAIEEYERTGLRLNELSEKIATLEHERTTLLLRIEDFDTLKRDAFMQAFNAVNTHFQSIFAELSDGDGHLALEDPENPFAAGLTLIAHPRGKKVRRLESMSGGEKSLTALSFIFALQRYRPSPFYAFDEVDMFLDGSNVERLARMLRHEANLAQFLVVSLRRPMIERSDRVIGVTLARAGHSQVLGVQLQQVEAVASQAS